MITRVNKTKRNHHASVVATIGLTLIFAATGNAADLATGQLLVGDQEPGLSGTCARGLTHVDLDSGEQYPLTVRLGTSGATTLANGDVLAWGRIGTELELIRITPATGAHRRRVLADNDFANPRDIVEDQNGDYVMTNDSAVSRLELQIVLTGSAC